MTTIVQRDEIMRVNASILSEISPELVLVDPELALVARAALESPTGVRAMPPETGAGREPTPEPPLFYALDPPRLTMSTPLPARGRRESSRARASRLLSVTVPAVLFGSLLVSLALAGALLGASDLPGLAPSLPAVSMQASLERLQEEPGNASAVTKAPAVDTTRPTRRPATATRHRAKPSAMAKAAAERTVLGLLQTAPRSRITKLLDPKTGLLENNVQAVCRRRSGSGPARFLCVIRSASAPRGAGLFITYTARRDGLWSATWLGYRTRADRAKLGPA
jgi:hypothetical protein